MKAFIFSAIILTVLFFGNNILAQEKPTLVQSHDSLTISNLPVTEESLRDGLVMHLPFDQIETGDNKVIDASGQGNNGKASGVRWTPDGKQGGAYVFVADGDKIVVPNSASLNPKQLTLSAWVKTSCRDDKWRCIFDKHYSLGYAMVVAAERKEYKLGGLVGVLIGKAKYSNFTRTKITDGQWHHVVVAFDGFEQLIFVDGKPEGPAKNWDKPEQTDLDLIIGCNGYKEGSGKIDISFRGLIDEPMIWNRALTIQEVDFLYRKSSCTPINNEQALIKDNKSQSNEIDVDKNYPKILKGVEHFTDNDIRFRTTEGTIVLVDPLLFPTDELVVKPGMDKPNLILITHSHGDHFSPSVIQQYLSLNPNVIIAGPPDVVTILRKKGMTATEVKPDESYTMAGIKFSTVPAYFLDNDSHPKANEWVGYIIQFDGTSYYITGDTLPLPKLKDLKADVILPLLYGCGANLDAAIKMVELTQAHTVVPVHHSNQEGTIKQFIAKIPEKVQCYYYLNGKLITEL
jgi:L-ascorbate metabolism protein UlaG (beta-lactamase superfamily)